MQISDLTTLQLFFCPQYCMEVSKNILERLKCMSVRKFPGCPSPPAKIAAAPISATSLLQKIHINNYVKIN
jgi:hypothetical protein